MGVQLRSALLYPLENLSPTPYRTNSLLEPTGKPLVESQARHCCITGRQEHLVPNCFQFYVVYLEQNVRKRYRIEHIGIADLEFGILVLKPL